MGLDNLTTDEIIEVIKRKEAPYHSKGYLYFDNKKLSPSIIFETLLGNKDFNTNFYTSTNYHSSDKNIYTKLLSILSELNEELIYLKLPDGYKGKISKLYNSQLKFLSQTQPNNSQETSMKQHPLNQILYGPPGTGKTYNTINKALKIIDGEVPRTRKDAKEKFDEYREDGQIEFVTFHQSYGYEEFVEGIKADLESDAIQYILEDGIFKKLVEKATTKSQSNFDDKIEELKDKIINEGSFDISDGKNTFNINYRGRKTFSIKPKNSKKSEQDYPASIENIFKMYKDNNRKDIYNPTYVRGVLNYLYDNKLVKYDNVKEEEKNYILIIDEINRGNISKIFGELITLIEPNKRIGAEEELMLTLANSNDSFGVPLNLYIIGTMNTADRSIAQIDTALRRRFEFVEMMPKPELIADKDNNPIVIDGIDVQKVLKAINERIEYIYDREHTIGHSYFMPLIKTPKEDRKNKLDEIFKVNILPLLAEYFYGDWADIIEVLNNNKFITEKILTYTTKTDKGNKMYKINNSFKADEYRKIYAK